MREVSTALLALVTLVGCSGDSPPDERLVVGPPAPPAFNPPPGSEEERRLFGVCIPFELPDGRTVCVMSTPQDGTAGALTQSARDADATLGGSASAPLLSTIPSSDDLPARVDHRADYLDGCTSISNQEHCGWCAVHAATALLESIHCSKRCDVPELSEAHLRYESRGRVPFEGCSEGWNIRTALELMSSTPIASASTWPYVGSGRGMNAVKPDDATLRAASVHKATGYQVIGGNDLVAIKRILASEREVLISVPVYRSPGWGGSSAVDAPTPATPCACGDGCADMECLRGYHAIVLVGYDDATREFIFQNSWGKDWGDGGYGRMSYAFVEGYATSAGYLEDVDTDLEGNACDNELAPCAENLDCASCTAESGCGWCGDGEGACASGTSAGPSGGSCGDWQHVTCAAATDPCQSVTDCATCGARPECAWCEASGKCFGLAARTEWCGDPRTTAEECGSCAGADCISCAGSTACGWCGDHCVVGGAAAAERDDCGDYRGEASMCDGFDPCSAADGRCGDCTSTSGCGYCAGTGTCVSGGFSGPTTGECASDWDWFRIACESDMPMPMCPSVGILCDAPEDCCTGEVCVVDRCEDCAGKLFVGDACTTGEECCGQLVCSGIASPTDTRCCLRDQDPCANDAECCGEMRCVSGACQCQSAGQPCLTGRECCGASICDSGTCT